MKDAIQRLFNWKKYPESVFYFVIPLAILGFSAHFILGIYMLITRDDPVFLIIVFAGVALLVFALWPIRKLICKSIGGHHD